MYKLYWSPGSAAMAPHAVLLETGARFELVAVNLERGEQRSADYLKLNPNARVPTLVTPDGTAIFEAAAICLFLADRHPEAGLAPALDDALRGPYLQWLSYMSNTLQMAAMRYYYPDRVAAPDHAAEVAAKAIEEVTTIWERIDRAIGAGPYMLGERYSACDAYLLMLSTWSESAPDLYRRCPSVKAVVDRVLSRPAILDMMRRHGLAA